MYTIRFPDHATDDRAPERDAPEDSRGSRAAGALDDEDRLAVRGPARVRELEVAREFRDDPGAAAVRARNPDLDAPLVSTQEPDSVSVG
jgi:hypothetical protein